MGGGDILKKAFTKRFVLDTLKSRKFLSTVMDSATVDAHGMFYICPQAGLPSRMAGLGMPYKTISVGSALLVQLCWAMREPQGVGRATGRISTLFLYA